ncbi:MAG TPA: CpsD/CapB family tyrosine-protein kinase [Bryobacteraceae bacterium]|nr:CpsD/CapB family tyrosine-protein kinase [Bryobacteraceae bacterium]
MTQNTAVRTALSGPAQLKFDLPRLDSVRTAAFSPAPGAVLLDPLRPQETPVEEFGTLRTMLGHLRAERTIRTVLVTSSSPGEGKSFTAANLALAEAQLANNPTLLCDFDLRRPSVHRMLQLDRSPGVSDYLLGRAELPETIQRIGAGGLYVMAAGVPVINPLELLHLDQTRDLLEILSSRFRCVILDSPALLAASDASLLAPLVDGALLVARLGATRVDALEQAIQSLGQDNVLGIVANGSRRGAGHPYPPI